MRAIVLARLVAAAFALSLGGCSVNQWGVPGSITAITDESENGKTVNTSASGLHIYTEPYWGVHIGVIQTSLIYPVANSDPSGCVGVALGEAAVAGVDKAPVEYADRPILIDYDSKGLGVELAPYRFSFSLGLSHRRAVQVSADENFSFFYDGTSRNETMRFCARVTEDK